MNRSRNNQSLEIFGDGSDRMETCLVEAETCLRLGLKARAEALLHEVLEVEATAPQLCERVRELHQKLGRKGDIAQEILEMAIASRGEPARAEIYLQKALCLTVRPETVWKTAAQLGIDLVAGPCGLDESTEPESLEQISEPDSKTFADTFTDPWGRQQTDVQIQRVLEIVAGDERHGPDVATRVFDEFRDLAEGGWLLRRVAQPDGDAYVTTSVLPGTSCLTGGDMALLGEGVQELRGLLEKVAPATPVASLIASEGVWCLISSASRVALLRVPQTHLGRIMSRAQRLVEESC